MRKHSKRVKNQKRLQQCLPQSLPFLMPVLCSMILCHSPLAAALEIHQEDSSGNINQLNIGVGKSNSQDSNPAFQNHKIVTKHLQLAPYKSIDVQVPVTLIYEGGTTPAATIQASEVVINAIDIEVIGGRLLIKSDGFSSQRGLTITLNGSKLRDISLNSAFEASFRNMNSSELNIRARGTGELDLEGNAMRCYLDANGSHDIDMQNMHCSSLKISSLGSSDILAHAKQSLTGQLQGSIDLTVYGNPSERNIKAKGVSEVSYD